MSFIKKISSCLLSLACLCVSVQAEAGSISTYAWPMHVLTMNNGLVFLEFISNTKAWSVEVSKPACNTTNRFVIDTSTAGGRALFAQIMLAQAGDASWWQGTAPRQPRVSGVVGTGTCNL